MTEPRGPQQRSHSILKLKAYIIKQQLTISNIRQYSHINIWLRCVFNCWIPMVYADICYMLRIFTSKYTIFLGNRNTTSKIWEPNDKIRLWWKDDYNKFIDWFGSFHFHLGSLSEMVKIFFFVQWIYASTEYNYAFEIRRTCATPTCHRIKTVTTMLLIET